MPAKQVIVQVDLTGPGVHPWQDIGEWGIILVAQVIRKDGGRRDTLERRSKWSGRLVEGVPLPEVALQIEPVDRLRITGGGSLKDQMGPGIVNGKLV